MIYLWILPAYLAYAASLWCITWVLYLAGMGIMAAQPVLYGTPAKLVVPVQHLAGYSSTLLNWTVFTVVLAEVPQEKFLSARLMRHKRHGSGWRQTVATKLMDTWLSPFDLSGGHT